MDGGISMPGYDRNATLPTLPLPLSLPNDLAPGTMLWQGRFAIRQLLGKGGSSSVYLASDRENENLPLAIKIFPANTLNDMTRQAVVREVELAKKLHHPHILTVFALYQEATRWFFTMEYVPGMSLRDWLTTRESVNWHEFSSLCRQLCDGLAYAHQFLCHCDLKPENILLQQDEDRWSVKISDFGLARLAGKAERRDDILRGTFPYLSPEQLQLNTPPDARVDIYALGVIFYETLTHRLPLGCFPLPCRLRPELPLWLDDMLQSMLAYDPSQRFVSIAELQKFWQASASTEAAIQEDHRRRLADEERHYRALAAERLEAVCRRLRSSGIVAEWSKACKESWQEKEWQELSQQICARHGVLLPMSMLQTLLAEEKATQERRAHYLEQQIAMLHLLLQQGEWREAAALIAHLKRWGASDDLLLVWQQRLDAGEQEWHRCVACGEEYLNEQRYAEAASALEQALKLQPGSHRLRTEAHLARQKAQAEEQETEEKVAAAECDRLFAQWFKEQLLADWPVASNGYPGHFHFVAADFRYGTSARLARAYQEEYARRYSLPLDLSIALPDDTEMCLKLIPPGIFLQGSVQDPTQSRPVLLPLPFYCGIYPVTQVQWEAVTGRAPDIDKGPLYPVERVPFAECQEFVDKLSYLSNRHFSLPSEAEWEYACRAGSITAYSHAEEWQSLNEVAWYGDNSDGHTHAVGLKKANAWGLFDMHGQVWEWCNDWYGGYDTSFQLAPGGPPAGKDKVWRGGNVCALAHQCTSFYRQPASPLNTTQIVGLRVVAKALSGGVSNN
jgi:formylglycine-generating enzyme required for sulfatase activity